MAIHIHQRERVFDPEHKTMYDGHKQVITYFIDSLADIANLPTGPEVGTGSIAKVLNDGPIRVFDGIDWSKEI